MSIPENAEASASSLRTAASCWYVRMQGGRVSDDVESGFRQWLAESAANQAAYQAVGRMQDRARNVGNHPQILALRHQVAIELTQRNSRWSRLSLRVAVAAAVMAGAVGLGLAMDVPGWIAGKGRYATQTGERIQILLPDQSQMTLNTQTRVRTVFSDHERRVVLKEGQAFFGVNKDPRRPFIVEAAGRTLIAVGTAFDVRVEGDQVQVTMAEGAVKVPALDAGAQATLIRSGDQVVIGQSSPDRAPQAIGSDGVERVTSWREGRVIFDDAPLSEAIAEMNRYSGQKVVLGSPELADRKVNGAFAIGNTQAFVEAMTAYFPIQVSSWDRRAITLKTRR